MKKYWVSWYHEPAFGGFELNTPWWISGTRGDDDCVCAAIKANSGEEAKEMVRKSYDKPPKPATIEWRFCTKKPKKWSPFGERFPKADWMSWE